MLSNAYFFAKFRFDTAENEPAKNLQNLAKKKHAQRLDALLRAQQVMWRDWLPDPCPVPGAADQLMGVIAEHGRRPPEPERRLAKFRQNVARFRLYRLRFLQENMRFAAFLKIYQILKLKFLKFDKICKYYFATFAICLLKFHENCCFFFQTDFLRKF